MEFYMIHNEKQLRKIIKEVANYSLLKEINFADNNSFGMFGGNSFGGRNNKNKTRNKNAIKIDDETCKDITTTVQNSVIKKGKRVMRIICNSQ